MALCFHYKLEHSSGAKDWLILNKSPKISNGTHPEMKEILAATDQMLVFCGINCPLAGTCVLDTCVYACLVCDQHQKTTPYICYLAKKQQLAHLMFHMTALFHLLAK